MKAKVILMILIWTLGLAPLFGADFWEEKPYQEWTEKECEKLLSDTPWSRAYALTGVNIPGMMNGRPGGSTPSRSFGDDSLTSQTGDREVHVFLQIRFLSARPVRAAVGQMRMLANPGNPDLESQVKQYVEQDDGPEIAVEITYYSEPTGHWALRDVEGAFRKATLQTIQHKAWLSDSSRDTRVPILRYQGPTEEHTGALLFFSRYDEDGNPHFDGTEDEILLHLEADFGEVDLLLDPEKMRFDQEFTL